MKTFEPGYNAATVLADKALVACRLQNFIEDLIENDSSHDAPELVRESKQLAELLANARKFSSLTARLLLAYTQEWIRLFRITEDRPYPDGPSPRGGATPSVN